MWDSTFVHQEENKKGSKADNLASMFETCLRRLFSMQCRQVFWSLIKRDKVEEITEIFDFLLTNPKEMKSFKTFLKVLGNEYYHSGNPLFIKSFKTFLKTVINLSLSQERYKQLLQIMVFDGIIDAYAQQLPNIVKQNNVSIHEYFKTEAQAALLTNPYIIVPIIKTLLNNKEGYAILSERADDLISTLLTINHIFAQEPNL